ncbi:hypothetical protein CH359_06590 [Leptospira meyeri]|nr:hypothetical protein CH359_06590 [Leptospira meyeri]PKA26050.1 hypothetical protein CH381_12795 [Leptospira sp. mixed culture ATI2-C-A1]PJZ97143.1 hypothetical protein CH358_08260 [Leptospira meyeri]TGL15479.1 hypothetical protein EHQ50_06005 [Leptospira meyeri]TGM63731.1 hypothetical protein EHQ94_13870 [Leptospira meyeri]
MHWQILELDSRQYPSNPLPKKRNWVQRNMAKLPAIHRFRSILPIFDHPTQKSSQFLDKFGVVSPAF